VSSKLPTLRRYAEIDVNEKQYSELVEILDQFTVYVIIYVLVCSIDIRITNTGINTVDEIKMHRRQGAIGVGALLAFTVNP